MSETARVIAFERHALDMNGTDRHSLPCCRM